MLAERKSWELPVLAVLFLFALSLFNLAGYLFALAAVAMLAFNITKLRISTAELLLFLFSGLYFGFYSFHYGVSIESVILYLLGPWCAYMMGKLYLTRAGNKNAFPLFLMVLSGGMFLHGLLNWAAYLNSDYFALYDHYRQSVDIWRGTLANVNSTGMMFTFAAGISMGILFSSLGKGCKLAAGVVLALCVAASVFFANRALLFIVAVIAAAGAIRCFFGRCSPMGAKLLALLAVMFLAAAAAILLWADVGGIGSRLGSLKLVQRLLQEDFSGRLQVWSEFLVDGNALRHPWGGGVMLEGSSYNYFHNLWLDVYNQVGILPFLALTACTLCLLGQIVRFRAVMLEQGRRNEYLVFLCLAAASFLNCMVEPVMEANPYYFLMILMFFGAMEGAMTKYMKTS